VPSNGVQNEDQKPRMRICKNDKKANGFSVGAIVNFDFPADFQLTLFYMSRTVFADG